MSTLENQLSGVEGDLKRLLDRQTKYTDGLDALQRQVDAIDIRVQGRTGGGFDTGGGAVDLARRIWDREEFKNLATNLRGRALFTLPDLSLKSTITTGTVGSATSGVLVPQRVPGVVTEARRQLRLRDLLTVLPCNSNAVDFVKVSSGMTKASPQVEANDKAENAMSFSTESELVQTIATWIPASRQVLEDFTALQAAVNSALIHAVLKEEEAHVLFGSGVSPALNGLCTQAQSWDISNLVASDGYEYVDIIGGAVQQIAESDEPLPDFVVLHPGDWHKVRRHKTTTGEYVFGAPTAGMPNRLWELQVIPSTGMTEGSFLVGNSSVQCVALFERMGMTIDVSTEHEDFFVKNLVAIRGEERVALVVFRPNAFVTGSLTQSPA